MRNRSLRLIVIALSFCIAFSGLTLLSGELISNALPSKPTLKVSLNKNNKPYLSWNKVSSPYSGYAVFKNGKVLKRYGTGTISFTDSSVGQGVAGTYQIKTYKKSKKTKKITQWYNKKTKKWQNSKPAKKYRGKSRKVKKKTYSYSYKTASNKVKITTRKTQTIECSSNGSVKVFKKVAIDISSSSGLFTVSTSNDNMEIKEVDGKYYIYTNKPGKTTVTITAPQTATYLAATKAFTVTIKCRTHSYDDGVVETEANCKTNRILKYTCKVCGDTQREEVPDTQTSTHNWDAGTITKQPTYTSTGIKQYKCKTCGASKTETIPMKQNPGNMPLTSWINMADDDFPIGSTITTTDYLGRSHELEKYDKNSWEDTSYGGAYELTNPNKMVKISTKFDGTWTSGGNTLTTYKGATFNITKIQNNYNYSTYTYTIDVYNCNAEKLSIIPDSSVSIVRRNTYDVDKNEIVKYYYQKNNKWIAQPYNDGTVFKTEKEGNITKVKIRVYTCPGGIGDALGMSTDTFNFIIKYDGKQIATKTVDTTKDIGSPNESWTINTCNKMSPIRKLALKTANDLLAGKTTGDFNTDMNTLANEFKNKYYYYSYITDNNTGASISCSCVGGALVLETYALSKGLTGFRTYDGGQYGSHARFHLDRNINEYWETQGYK